jgi:tRNA (cmo5U34)-methyltransferase
MVFRRTGGNQVTNDRGQPKSTVEEIRKRFDADVERFSHLETGQAAVVDSPLAMALLAEVAAALVPQAASVLDIGCGAGNYTLKLLERLPKLNVTMVDLSKPMLDRALERVRPATTGSVEIIQGDIREIDLGLEQYDIVLAASVLHHLRSDAQWRAVFGKLYRALRPGGAMLVFDLIESSISPVQAVMWRRYGEFLTQLKDEAYRDQVFAYVEGEDTPRPLTWQLDLLREVGFSQVDVLHKNGCFAAFGALKS